MDKIHLEGMKKPKQKRRIKLGNISVDMKIHIY